MPIGVDLPITLGKTGYFSQTETTLEEAKVNLINLLFTRRGERVMQPTFGTRIYEILFENITLDIPGIVEEEIREQVKIWIPYISIQKIVVDASPENIDNNRIRIEITFGITAEATEDRAELETINLEFNF